MYTWHCSSTRVSALDNDSILPQRIYSAFIGRLPSGVSCECSEVNECVMSMDCICTCHNVKLNEISAVFTSVAAFGIGKTVMLLSANINANSWNVNVAGAMFASGKKKAF